MVKALQLLGGNRDLLKKLQTRFVARLDDFVPAFRQALTEYRTEDALRQVHTLKGIAGSAGAMEVHAAAISLEKICRSGGDIPLSIEAETRLMEDAVRRARAALEAILGKADDGNNTARTSSQSSDVELVALLRELHGQLSESDTAATTTVGRFDRMEWSTDHATALQRIGRAVKDYDFSAGLAEVDALLLVLETD
jgi:HPt (histidine-containing phosphotransfer) domain-containing protein